MIADPGGKKLTEKYFELYPEEAAWQWQLLTPEQSNELAAEVSLKRAAKVFSSIDTGRAAVFLHAMSKDLFTRFIAALDPVRAAAMLSRLNDRDRKERLGWISTERSRELEELMSYPSDSAGALMDPFVITFTEKDTVQLAVDKIRAQGEKRLLDLCVTSKGGKFAGMLSVRQLVTSEPGAKLGELADRNPTCVQAMQSKEEVVELLEKGKLSSLPVVDAEDRLVGVIRYDALLRAVQQDATADIASMVGVSPQERALSKISFAVKKRLPWLQVNLLTTFIAASVVGFFEQTIAKYTALAVLLPVVAGQSGNTGAQALAVVVRGLALREVRVRQWFAILAKEMGVGVVNGCLVGITCSLGVYLWSGSTGLAFVIGLSMVLSMLIASVSGAAVPILLTVFKQDPAQSSSIVLTTITDVFGFLSFLGLATLLSSLLQVA